MEKHPERVSPLAVDITRAQPPRGRLRIPFLFIRRAELTNEMLAIVRGQASRPPPRHPFYDRFAEAPFSLIHRQPAIP